MSKLPSFTPRQVIARYKKLGFVEDHKTGNHLIMYHPVTTKRAVIPFHLRDLPKGTLVAILRESGVSRKEFLKKRQQEN